MFQIRRASGHNVIPSGSRRSEKCISQECLVEQRLETVNHVEQVGFEDLFCEQNKEAG